MHIMKANISYAGVLMYIYGSAHGDTIQVAIFIVS